MKGVVGQQPGLTEPVPSAPSVGCSRSSGAISSGCDQYGPGFWSVTPRNSAGARSVSWIRPRRCVDGPTRAPVLVFSGELVLGGRIASWGPGSVASATEATTTRVLAGASASGSRAAASARIRSASEASGAELAVLAAVLAGSAVRVGSVGPAGPVGSAELDVPVPCGTVSAMIRSGGSSRARSSLGESPTSGTVLPLVSARTPPLPTAVVVVPSRARIPASMPARAVVAFAGPAAPAVPDPPVSAASAQSAGQRHPALP